MENNKSIKEIEDSDQNDYIISIDCIPSEEVSHFKGSILSHLNSDNTKRKFIIVRRRHLNYVSSILYELGYDYTDKEKEIIIEKFNRTIKV